MKELPYFKFYCNEWITGNITFLDYETQGLFINLCAFYWSKNGSLKLNHAKLKFNRIKQKSFESLIEHEIIKINEHENIIINFLDEQMNERGKLSVTNSKNGALGGRPKKQIESENKPTALILESELKAKKSNIEEKRREEKKDILSTESIDFGVLLNYINSSFNRKFKIISESVKTKFKARIKEKYSKDDIKNCIDNLKNIQYHIDNGFQYCTPEFISRADTLDKYSVKTAEVKLSGDDEYYNNVMKQVNANKLL